MIRVLVANTELPSKKIGSWTNRITRLLEEYPAFFDYILSPTTNPSSSHIFCKKKKWIPFFPKKLRSWEVLNHQAGAFIKAFQKLSIQNKPVQVVVMDDMLLLEAFALLKLKGYEFELIFSFHGHSFQFSGPWASQVNKVLFLTQKGYLETFSRHEEFTPLVSVIGNGVDSGLFFPLSKSEKAKRKQELGIDPNSPVLIWLSNNRPKKGLYIFQKLAQSLLAKYPDLEILIIGAIRESKSENRRVHYLGKIPNHELPHYLQSGDFYAFPSLWKEGFGLSLAEALKCGNQVLASNTGGIPEVIEGVPGSFLIHQPNVVEAWEAGFEEAWKNKDEFIPNPDLLAQLHDLGEWKKKFLAALE